MPNFLGAAAGFDIVRLGVNTVDLLAVVGDFPAPDSKHQLHSVTELPGGETATALSACAQLGWRALCGTLRWR
jgi:sugar/nucleoside kinase (ribokinase family)